MDNQLEYDRLRTFVTMSSFMRPIIEDKRKSAIQRLLTNYRNGAELTGPTAELAAYTSLLEEMDFKTTQYDQLQQRLNNSEGE